MKITIIGAGNMGGAIARGLAKGNIFKESDITVTARTQKTLDCIHSFNPQLNVTLDNVQAVKGADLVVLAVKPWLLDSVISHIRTALDLSSQIIISVVAGVSFADLKDMLCKDQEYDPVMFRVIPNTAISIGESMSLIAESNATDEQVALVKSVLDELGKTAIIEEKQMGAATALCSCGIAYAFRYIKASIDGAVEMGLYPRAAKDMVVQTLRGAADLLDKNDSMPDEETYKVTTPGGITIKGLNEMEACGFTNAVVKGLKASNK